MNGGTVTRPWIQKKIVLTARTLAIVESKVFKLRTAIFRQGGVMLEMVPKVVTDGASATVVYALRTHDPSGDGQVR
jgi:hypothetical protein